MIISLLVATGIAISEAVRLELIEGSNDFGYNLMSNLYQDKSSNRNVWISPFCISSCFSLVYAGSCGETKSQIAKVMGYPDGDNLDATKQFFIYQELIESMFDGKGASEWQKKSIIGIANKIYASKSLLLKQSYIEALDNGKKSFIESIDFESSDAPSIINKWVNESTNGLIDSIIAKNEDTSQWRLMAMNAIYLNGTFRSQFKDFMTSSNAFYSDTARTNKVSNCHLMHQFDYFDYYENGKYQFLKFPFSDSEDLFLLFALPITDDLGENGLITDKNIINDALNKLKRTYLALALPKLSIEAKYILNGPLEKMGLVDAFTSKADFSKISSIEELYFNQVIHKTMVEMNENGLVAAAVTALLMMGGAFTQTPDPILFKADHTFQLFIIDGELTNTILFMGLIKNPGISKGSKTPTFDESSDPIWNNVSTSSEALPVITTNKAERVNVIDKISEAAQLELIEGSNEFGYSLMSHLCEDKSSNHNEWISPFCISSCFALVYPGSCGETKSQIANVMGYAKGDSLTKQFFILQSLIENTFDGQGENEWQKKSIIGIANKIYASDTLALKQSYIDALDNGKQSFIESIDFGSSDAPTIINLWVNESTNGLIDSIIDKNEDTSQWRLAALNAIYLNGTFRSKFKDYLTSSNEFYSDTSRTKKVSDCHLMHQMGYFDYYDNGEVQFLKFPFSDSADLFLLFALPITDDGLDKTDIMTEKNVISEALQKLKRTYVALALPKLSIEATYPLKGPLMDLGMNDAFTSNADFSKITNEPLFIDKVIHKTMVEMDENGLVAAAATMIAMSMMAIMSNPVPILFKADHIFQLFIIDGEHDNTILFMGNINKPGIPKGSKTPTFDESSDPIWNNFSIASDLLDESHTVNDTDQVTSSTESANASIKFFKQQYDSSESNIYSKVVVAIVCVVAALGVWFIFVV